MSPLAATTCDRALETGAGERSARRTGRYRARDLLGFLLVMLGGVASIATNLADDADPVAEEGALVTCSEAAECEGSEATPHCLESYGFCVECLEDGHCSAEERCFENRCAAACTDSGQCSGELTCVDGLCRQCQTDVDCGDPSLYCYVGEAGNACRPLCSSSEECGGPGYAQGDVCRAGRCQTVSCSAPQDCLVDRELCSPDTGQCVPITGAR